MAPLKEDHTARTLGKGTNEWSLAGGYIGHVSASYKRGWSDNFDLGLQAEFQSNSGIIFGIDGKYSLNKEKPLALLFGAGSDIQNFYGYMGLIKSFQISQSYEISFNARYNYVWWGLEQDVSDSNDEFISDIIEQFRGSQHYLSIDFSNTYWATPGIGVTAYIGAYHFFTLGQDFPAPKVGLKLHFKY